MLFDLLILFVRSFVLTPQQSSSSWHTFTGMLLSLAIVSVQWQEFLVLNTDLDLFMLFYVSGIYLKTEYGTAENLAADSYPGPCSGSEVIVLRREPHVPNRPGLSLVLSLKIPPQTLPNQFAPLGIRVRFHVIQSWDDGWILLLFKEKSNIYHLFSRGVDDCWYSFPLIVWCFCLHVTMIH